MDSNELWLCRTAPKLKHTTLKEIYYQLLKHLLFLHIIPGIIVAVINFKVVK